MEANVAMVGKNKVWWLARLPALVVAVGVVLTLGVGWQLHQIETAERQATAAAWEAQMHHEVHERMEAYMVLLRGVAGLFAASEEVTEAEFGRYIHSLSLEETHPALVGLGAAFRFTSPDELEPFSMELASFGGERPERDEEEVYFPAVHFAPERSPFDRLLGYDLLSHPEAQRALLACWDDVAPAVSPALRVWPDEEEIGRQKLLFSPLKDVELPDRLATDGAPSPHQGVVFSIVDADAFWSKALGPLVQDRGVWVLQAGPDDEEAVIWTTGDQEDEQPVPSGARRTSVEVAGGQWEVALVGPPLGERLPVSPLTLAAVVMGLTVTGLMFMGTRCQGRAWLVAEDQAEQLKRAREGLRQANTDLEAQVARRTAVAESRAAQLRALAEELTLAEQRERRRLAEVLHDHLQQFLVAAQYQVHRISQLANDPQLEPPIGELQKLLNDSIEASRHFTVELSPPVLHEHGVSAAMRWLSQWMRQRHDLCVDVELDDNVRIEDENLRILTFQSVRELLFNTVKYSGVNRAKVHLRRADPEHFEVLVADEGRGFDPNNMHENESGGFGLFSIRQRLELVGGQMRLWSTPGVGTTVQLIVPLPEENGARRTAPGYAPRPAG